MVEEVGQQPSRNHPNLDVGAPGASADREYERRHAKREQQIREKHPRTAGLRLALSEDPQSTRAWGAGAVGEERLGERLNELSSDTIRVLHDRCIPGTRTNIDHLAITPTGVSVIDTKRYRDKRPSLKLEGGIVRPRVKKLMVGSRDQTKLLEASPSRSTSSEPSHRRHSRRERPLLQRSGLTAHRRRLHYLRKEVLWPRKPYPQLAAEGPIATGVDELHPRMA